jgi:hypothetical protein
MILTELYDGQGLGNQLWVYAACRAIAERLGYPHRILSPQKFKGNHFLDIDRGEPSDGRPAGSAGGDATVSRFHERFYYDHELEYYSSDFDSAVLALEPNTKIDGVFQSEQYFFGDLSSLPSYMRIKPEHLARRHVPDDSCVLNLRGGEYKRHKNLILPRSYWVDAMRNMRKIHGVERFMIVTDDRRYARALLPDLPVLEGGIAECYVALHQANHLILSNSSFAYFPVKTSTQNPVVIAPKLWARFGNVYGRWASPANLYSSWLWQDPEGKLQDYGACLPGREQTVAHYKAHYHYAVTKGFLERRPVRMYFPGSVRKRVKSLLSRVFPRHYG